MQPDDSPQAGGDAPAAVLDPIEARVLGCLIEKAATTPESYPLTLNATVLACNQKTSREPIMDLEPGEVGNTLRRLEDKKLVRVQHASRALRYEHRVDEAWTITPRQRAVLCVLMLRGAQTLGEIHTRCERLAQFPTLDDVRDTVERLMSRTPAMAMRIGRGAGQREDRYVHLLCGEEFARQSAPGPGAADNGRDDAGGRNSGGGLADRVQAIEDTIAALESRLTAMQSAIDALRRD